VRGFAVQSIYELQQTSKFVSLLKAANALHKTIERWDFVRWCLGILLAILAIIGIFVPEIRGPLGASGFVVGILTTAAWPRWRQCLSSDAAVVQEMFDTGLFGLEWSRSQPAEKNHVFISRWARKKFRRNTAPWYVDVRRIPSPVAEALCQRENAIWDADLRSAWVILCKTMFWVLTVVLILIGVALDLSVWHFFLWIVFPLTSLLGTVLSNTYQQSATVAGRRSILANIELELKQLHPSSSVAEINSFALNLRGWQDDIFRSRLATARVPSWFHALLRDKNETDHAYEVEAFRAKWGAAYPET
jgi:hypothetical protein